MTSVSSRISLLWLLVCLTVCPCRASVKGFKGQNVTLPCKYDWHLHGKCEICWMRGDIPISGCGDEIIASNGDEVVRQTSDRYQLSEELQKGDASLTIVSTTQKDSGKYGCRVHVPGLFNDEKNIVHLVIMEEPVPTAEVNSSLSSVTEIVTMGPSEPTRASSTRHYSTTSNPESNETVSQTTDDMLPVTVVSILLLLLVLGTAAIFLIWKRKRRNRVSLEIDQNSNASAIYSNSDIGLGLNNRSMALENIYQLDTENEYEQWSR